MSHTSDFQLRFWTRFWYHFSLCWLHFVQFFRILFLWWFFSRIWSHFWSKNALSELRTSTLGALWPRRTSCLVSKTPPKALRATFSSSKGSHLDVFQPHRVCFDMIMWASSCYQCNSTSRANNITLCQHTLPIIATAKSIVHRIQDIHAPLHSLLEG